MTTLDEVIAFQEEEFEKTEKIVENFLKFSEKEVIDEIMKAHSNSNEVNEKLRNFHFNSNSNDYPFQMAYSYMAKSNAFMGLELLESDFFYRTMKNRKSRRGKIIKE